MTSWRPIRIALLATTALMPLALGPALANPLGYQIVGGNIVITDTNGKTITINQLTQNGIINWQQFNLGVGDLVQFFQPNGTAMTLNRVIGGLGPSTINGTITANGRVFIVNPDGILIGRGASINAAGFLATTHDIANADFMANRLNFNIPGRPDASIVNEGIITATNGGFAALVAPGVRNSGTITATFGKIGLAAANGFTLDLYGDQLITLGVNDAIATQVKDVATGLPLSALVKNDGVLRANGGRVELTAAAARVVVDSVINTSGVIEARTIGNRNGKIVLGAATKIAGLPPQKIKISGKLSVASKKHKAGTIQVTGENIALTNATLDATGYLGGGTVLIGGDAHGAKIPFAGLQIGPATTVTVDGSTVINASATHIGDAGKVVVWSDQSTTFAGTILARGGDIAGKGGFVEVSGKHGLNFRGLVDTRAPHGQTGTLLLDPDNYTIGPGEATTIANNLLTTNVKIETTFAGVGGVGDIIVASNITWSSDYSLELSAYRNIQITGGATIRNTAAGDLILRADNAGTGIGTLLLGAGTDVARIDYSNSTGKISLYYNPAHFPMPDFFPINVGNPQIKLNAGVQNQFTAYMLVNTVFDFARIPLNLAGNYALSRDLDATGVPFGANLTFSGIFDGLDHTVSNLLINGNGLVAVNNGTIRNVNLANVTLVGTGDNQSVGILAGINNGTISNVSVSGTLTTGLHNGLFVGGLVGTNTGTILGSSAAVDITTAGMLVAVGGLVGMNAPHAEIVDSYATGNVTATANLPALTAACAAANVCQYVFAGGLVGQNFGTLTTTYATGNISVGSRGIAGGLVGWNDGTIQDAYATGRVLGAPGPGVAKDFQDAGMTILGGLVGRNSGTITVAFATGDVGALGFGHLLAGGLVGDNSGTILGGIALGNVMAGDHSIAGGLVGRNDAFNTIACNLCVIGDGHNSDALITVGLAGGNVTVGSASIAGGLAGLSSGTLLIAIATGNVLGADNTLLGGLVGVATNPNNGVGLIMLSAATGSVTSTGANSIVGGLVGLNAAFIQDSFAVGQVTATANSYVGGFAGLNVGLIANSATLPGSAVTVTGVNNVVGGFVGANFGTIADSQAFGDVTGPANNLLGSFAGANTTFINLDPNLIPGSTFPVGTITNSTGTGTVNGQNGPQIASITPSTLPDYPTPLQNCTDVICQALINGKLAAPPAPAPNPPPPPPPIVNNPIPPPPDNTPPVILTTLTPPAGPPLGPGPGGPGVTPPGLGPAVVPRAQPFAPPQFTRTIVAFDGTRLSGVPPLKETRFFRDEVVLQMRADLPADVLARRARELCLTGLNTEVLPSLGRQAVRFRIGCGRTVRDVIRVVEQDANFLAQPNYQFVLSEGTELAQAPASLPPATTDPDDNRGDPAQYIIEKFHVRDVHRVASGADVIVAVIDSAVDKDHSELAGTILKQFDAVGVQEKPHSHATAMIGAMVARDRLLGVAPRARILAVHAFAQSQTTAEGTTFNILRGIEWAVNNGARIINMSFAGPYDPALEKALKAAYDKGVVLVGAAGNAGPKSPPLFPGADVHVIGVTATDNGDKAFKGANIGAYIAVAAPGVEILAPAPQEAYQMSTGTSIATAHVTAVVALMIERDPTLKPDDVRKILQETAIDLGTKGKDNQFGWGLVDPQKALAAVEERKKRPAAANKP